LDFIAKLAALIEDEIGEDRGQMFPWGKELGYHQVQRIEVKKS
jgi:hypothetical protein